MIKKITLDLPREKLGRLAGISSDECRTIEEMVKYIVLKYIETNEVEREERYQLAEMKRQTAARNAELS